jgi:hypothetical protein
MKWTSPGHEYDEIGKHLRQIRDVYIFSDNYKYSSHYILSRMGLRVFFIRPNSEAEKKYGEDVTLDEYFSLSQSNHVILISEYLPEYHSTIHRLHSNGYKLNYDYFTFHPDTRKNTFLELYLLYIHDFLLFPSLCLICTTVCNLKCKACLNFTIYNKKQRHIPFDNMKKGIDDLFSHIDYVNMLQISGGEPLLYPHLNEIFEYLCEYYRESIGELNTVTNGTIMPSDELCSLMQKNNIRFIIDDYRPNVKCRIDEIIKKCDDFGVQAQHKIVREWIDLAPFSTDYSEKSDEFLIDHNNHCACPWSEINNGVLYACNYAHYAEEAGIAEYDEGNFLDLAQSDISKKLIYEFRSRYTPNGYLQFCKHCAGFFNNPHKTPAAEQII